METAGHSNMCRCCASEGAFKDIKSTYHWMGEEEIYADMLKDCFDINLNVSEHGEDGGICEVCITQLRNAINFKKQVQHTEEQFKKHLQNKTLFRPHIVKVEVAAEEDSEEGDIMGSGDDAFSGAEFEVPIKTEDDEPKPKKRSKAAATSTRSKKSKSDDGEPSTKRLRSRTIRDSSPILCEDEDKTISLDRKLNFASFVSIRPVGKKAIPWVRQQQQKIAEERRLTELDWQFDNIKTILRCSNATPVRCRVGTRFACSYCLDQFQNPTELRNHSTQDHINDKPEFFNARSLSRHIVYLDITGLQCKICDQSIESLEQLMDHLKAVHDELVYKQIKNQIVPFKYDGRKVLCGVCGIDIGEYNDFQDHMSEHYRKVLCGVCGIDIGEYNDFQDHMSEHYRNYVCGFCDSGFVIRSKMLEHKKTVHLV